MTFRTLPDLAALVTDPRLASELAPEEARAVLLRVSVLAALLAVRAAFDNPEAKPPPPPGPAEPEWITGEEAGRRYGLSPGWLKEHRTALVALRLVSRPSRKLTLYRGAGLKRMIEARRLGPTSSQLSS